MSVFICSRRLDKSAQRRQKISTKFQRQNEKFDNGSDPLQSRSEIKVEIEEPTNIPVESNERHNYQEIVIDWKNCDDCGMKFPLENMLNRHKLGHINTARLRKRSGNSAELKNVQEKLKRLRESQPKPKYNCSLCEFTCATPTTLVTHLRISHCTSNNTQLVKTEDVSSNFSETRNRESNEIPVTFNCGLCNFVCKQRSTLLTHVTKKHPKVKIEPELAREERERCEINLPVSKKRKKATEIVPLKCNSCDFECTKKSALSSHRRCHRTNEDRNFFSCNECDFKTEKKSSFYSHFKRKHGPVKAANSNEPPELFSCSQCDYKNKNKYEVKVHVARKHTDDFKFPCDTCTKKFKVKGDLTNHVRFSHREQPVICDVCGKTCLNSNSLYVHQKFAHYKAKYECQICKRRMVSQANLDEHMLKQHEKRENVVCEECGKTFTRNSRLKIHMRIHTGDRPYECKICKKTFARRTALKQHLLIHTGVRPYICDICGKAFTQKPGLISHRKSHPGPLPPLPRVLIDHILCDVLKPDV